MIALVTDSNAQLPAVLRDRYGIRVVPLGVVVDGQAYREGVDLEAEVFYAAQERGASVSTAAPSVGEVTEAYRQAAD
ncbi:MAG: DegV family protein, partial [Actinomycetes bacterium]